MADIEKKVKIASSFLLSSPPGEVNDVFNDVRALVDNDEALQDDILSALEQHNLEQYATVIPTGFDYPVIISTYNKLEDRYFDPRSKKSFTFNHMSLAAENIEEYEAEDNSLDTLRSNIDEAFGEYIKDHYPEGISSVFVKEKKIIIATVDNKYNPNNFWNGRWLSTWIYDTQSNQLTGKTNISVHYYEDGNVQLNADKTFEATIPNNDDAAKLVASLIKEISTLEKKYQTTMNNSYNELSDDTFKGLRRALPLTRNKLDWNKILNYKIGNELARK
ncbi:unnamed protein product [Cunninghamella blakesleeana]